jgi:hypothetical protein
MFEFFLNSLHKIYNKTLVSIAKLMPIKKPTDCDMMDSVYNSAGLYLKSLCIDIYARNYDDSKLNCLARGMQLYRTDSAEAIKVVLNVADENWTFQYWYVSLHIAANATGSLFVSNVNPSGTSEITIGSRTAYKQSVCEYVDTECELILFIYEKLLVFKGFLNSN